MNASHQTYSDERLDDISRRVYYKAMTKLEAMVDATEAQSTERMIALAQVADASACGFASKDEDTI